MPENTGFWGNPCKICTSLQFQLQFCTIALAGASFLNRQIFHNLTTKDAGYKNTDVFLQFGTLLL
jgi:hypothetical protein